VERKEASGCEKRVSTSGAFSTGWGTGIAKNKNNALSLFVVAGREGGID